MIIFLPALLQKLVGEFFDFGEGDFGEGNLVGILRDFLGHDQIKLQKHFRGNFQSIFREKMFGIEKNISCQLRSADVPP